jgi:hypothetical protein
MFVLGPETARRSEGKNGQEDNSSVHVSILVDE